MKISVTVKANSKQEKVEKSGEGRYLLWVRSPAKENKANLAVVRLLSEYFAVPQSRCNIIKGSKNKHKLIEII